MRRSLETTYQQNGEPAESSAYISSRHDCPSSDPCGCSPCAHFLSCDPDFIEDVDEMAMDPEFHHELWSAYYSIKYRKEVPADRLAELGPRIERCRRIEEKEPEIEAEMQYRPLLRLHKAGENVEQYLREAEEEVEAAERKLGRQFSWYERERKKGQLRASE